MGKLYSTDDRKKRDGKEYPPLLKFAVGSSAVLVVVDVRRAQQTQFGEKDVADVFARGNETTLQSIFWPKSIPLPPLNTAVYLRRVSEYKYEMLVAGSPEEEAALWRTGDPTSVKVETVAVERTALLPERFRTLKT